MRRVNITSIGFSFALVAVSSLGLGACGSSASSAATTTAATETTVADPPATTNAPAVPADVASGAATIKVTVGTDDFETSGGKRVVSVPKGTNVKIELTDAANDQQYHLHGYDVEIEAKKGATGTISFTADKTGQFDLESHTTNNTLLVVVVV